MYMTSEKEKQFSEFFAGYVHAALWSSTDTHPQTGKEVQLDECEESDSLRENLKPSAFKFFAENYLLLVKYGEERVFDEADGSFWEHAGHDFWLNRCGHGTGFWDQDSDAGNELNELVGHGTDYPNVDLYIGDDGFVYC